MVSVVCLNVSHLGWNSALCLAKGLGFLGPCHTGLAIVKIELVIEAPNNLTHFEIQFKCRRVCHTRDSACGPGIPLPMTNWIDALLVADFGAILHRDILLQLWSDIAGTKSQSI